MPTTTDDLHQVSSFSLAAAAAAAQLVGSTTLPFRICVGIILWLLTCVQLLVAYSFVDNRNSTCASY
jgi:hypothetical protein